MGSKLLEAAKDALDQMCKVTAPNNAFTYAVDRLDAAITEAERLRNVDSDAEERGNASRRLRSILKRGLI